MTRGLVPHPDQTRQNQAQTTEIRCLLTRGAQPRDIAAALGCTLARVHHIAQTTPTPTALLTAGARSGHPLAARLTDRITAELVQLEQLLTAHTAQQQRRTVRVAPATLPVKETRP